MNRRRRKMYCRHARLCVCPCVCVCLSVCLSAAVRPHYCTDPDATWGRGRGCPLVVQLGGFAIRARVVLLWQHNANPSYKLASIPRYDDIVRMLGGVCARCWPVTGRRRGAFSTLLRQPALRASTDSVLAT